VLASNSNKQYNLLTLWWEVAAECQGGPSKAPIINIIEVAEVVKNGKVSIGESVGIKKLKSFST
jgi:hypothetical protein